MTLAPTYRIDARFLYHRMSIHKENSAHINTLLHYSGLEIYKVIAEKAMAYICSSAVIASVSLRRGL
jgi:hypothetical protein